MDFKIKNIAVLGAGIMGHGIAQSFMVKGYQVKLYDIEESILQNAINNIETNLASFYDAELISKSELNTVFNNLTTTTNLEDAVKSADFVLEAAPELLDLKQELFESVENFCHPNTIIATNTSSLVLKDISVRVKRKKRLIITHWFNPPHIVPVVEVVKGEETHDDIIDITLQLLKNINKVPVRINHEVPGFLINRIQMAMIREVLDLYEKGIASASDIDIAIKGSIGFRLASIGPLLTVDLGGVNLWFNICKNLFPHICSSQKPPEILSLLASKGHDGVKSGKGFYDYTTDSSRNDIKSTITKRDKEFLARLKSNYMVQTS